MRDAPRDAPRSTPRSVHKAGLRAVRRAVRQSAVPLRQVRELEHKQQVIRRLAQAGKRGRTRFISAEGCYSAVVADTPGLRVKFSAKARR